MEPKLNLFVTKALLKDQQNLDWVGVGPEASIGKVMAKANLSKVSVEFAKYHGYINQKIACRCRLSKYLTDKESKIRVDHMDLTEFNYWFFFLFQV